jgi:hypothetical protein
MIKIRKNIITTVELARENEIPRLTSQFITIHYTEQAEERRHEN